MRRRCSVRVLLLGRPRKSQVHCFDSQPLISYAFISEVYSFLSSTMKKMAKHGNAPFLPEEIVSNIFKRLRVKFLIRFQCVCKFWKNLFRTPSFIADHLHHSSVQNTCLLFKRFRTQELLQLRLVGCEMHVLEVHNPPLIDSSSYYKIIGSSNGLLCVVIDSSCSCLNSLALWNPATGEVRQIPRTRTSEITEWDCNGFGFSAIVSDYKIVQTYNDGNEVIIGVEVYSLSTGSWKEIEFACLKDMTICTRSFNANGSIFWGAIKRAEEEFGLIVSFDLAMEVFTLIPYPDLSENSTSVFTAYEEKFCILSLSKIGDFPNYSYSQIDLWVLEEGIGSSTERWSWTKKYTSNPCPSQLDFPGTISRNEIILSFGEAGLYWINIITNECKMFAMSIHGFDQVFSYVENLVSLSNIHYEEP